MGVRNPFRIDVDRGDRTASPGATTDPTPATPTPPAGRWATSSGTRRPPGPAQRRLAVLHTATTRPTTTGTSRPPRPASSSTARAPTNNSRWNTGLADLPPGRARAPCTTATATTDQPLARAHRLRFRQSGQAPMGGPVYHYDADEPVDGEVPAVLGRQGVLRRVLPGLPRGLHRRRAGRAASRTIEHFLPNAALTADGAADQRQPDGHRVRA